MKGLVNYQLATKGFNPRLESGLYTYILGNNGLFVYSRNMYFEALIPVPGYGYYPNPPYPYVRGLEYIEPKFKIVRRVRWNLLTEVVSRAYNCLPNERLFYMWYLPLSNSWVLNEPDQRASGTAVTPVLQSQLYRPLEIHSHNTMGAFFSMMDDQDENGMRIYAVLGHVERPVIDIKVRASIYEYSMEINYMDVFEPCAYVRNARDDEAAA